MIFLTALQVINCNADEIVLKFIEKIETELAMWLLFALITFFAWGTADLFYKKSNERDEKYAHLKTSIVVGVIMGITAVITLIVKQVNYNPVNILIYLPVSLTYILSMTVGYFGLRYIELSVSSPIQNASGAVSCLLLIIVTRRLPGVAQIVAIFMITVGVVLLGVFERKKETLKSFAAFFMPILYCVIDSLGTFFDGWYLDSVSTTPLVGVTEDNIEDVANVSYQLTFLIVAALIFIYVVIIKKQPMKPKMQKDRLFAALFETVGQLTYVYALSGNGIVAAPVIASYCVCSAVLARIFMKEKLDFKQYISIALVVVGIVILALMEV